MDYLENLDIFEVEKQDYMSYYHRLSTRQLIKTRPQQNLTVYRDIELNVPVCGIETVEVMGTNMNRYFIFELLDEELLGEHKTYRKIVLSQEDYLELLSKLGKLNG